MKKMRRMIPALCMLLVSAIMLSTASYAWFTMNEQVTATGMEIQAQASGSLVISSDPLQSANADPNVKFETGVRQLRPITLKTQITKDINGEDLGVDDDEQQIYRSAWYEPFSTPAQANVVSPILGTPDYRGEKELTTSASPYYIQETVYIGTSGKEAISGGSIAVSLTNIASSADTLATKAYSVAVYIVGVATETKTNGKWTDRVEPNLSDNANPDMILHVDQTVVDGENRNTLTIPLPADVTIPSIHGFGEGNDNGTGLKVVLRFYVDGALKTVDNDKKSVDVGYTYTSVAATNVDFEEGKFWIAGDYVEVTKEEMLNAHAGKTPYGWFVKKTDGSYSEVDMGTDIVDADNTTTTEVIEGKYYRIDYRAASAADMGTSEYVPTTWFTREEKTERYNYNYVNNGTIPSVGTSLTVTFKHIPAAEDDGE